MKIMDEEMEYAEMLEIPVSTVNVTKKRGRKPKKEVDAQTNATVNEYKQNNILAVIGFIFLILALNQITTTSSAIIKNI